MRYAVDEADEAALFSILTSPLFAVSDDALLSLVVTCDEDGAFGRRSLWRGFSDPREDESTWIGEEDARMLALARRTLGWFSTRARKGFAERALRELFLETGYLDRLQKCGAVGLAAAGNLAKAARIVGAFEANACGIASLSHAYADHLATAKEAPGSLATVGADFVQIMTVHASKGLEFAHVAIADLGKGVSSAPSLIAENIGDNTFASARHKPADAAGKVADKLRSFVFEEGEGAIAPGASTPGALHEELEERVAAQTLAEAQRLLYVALTRAGKSLVLSYVTRSRPELAYEGDGIYGDVYSALRWACDNDECRSLCEYGGSAPARVDFHYLRSSADDEGDVAVPDVAAVPSPDVAPVFEVALRREPASVFSVPCEGARANVESYSSLSSVSGDLPTIAVRSEANFAVGTTGESAVSASSSESFRDEDDDATALGEAFHRLAQLSVVRERVRGSGRLEMPEGSCIEAQVRRCGLSDGQEERLRRALELWFGSDLAASFARRGELAAEVDFMVAVGDVDSDGFFLEGQIDALCDDGSGCAFLIDYKTGGFPGEPASDVVEKHAFQAMCYAYALLREGYRRVEACFARVEHACSDADEPQMVAYVFDESEVDALERLLLEARKARCPR